MEMRAEGGGDCELLPGAFRLWVVLGWFLGDLGQDARIVAAGAVVRILGFWRKGQRSCKDLEVLGVSVEMPAKRIGFGVCIGF